MRFSELCKKKKVINIGYVGGSITEDDKYRSHVLKYLEAKYPENSFVEIKGGVSGTPSYLGVHRFDRDVLSQNPDLVFIEFSVNDFTHYQDLFERSMEGMIRKSLKQNPDMIISVIGTAAAGYLKYFYFQGKEPEMVQSHKKVAAYYNIPYINVGKAFSDYIQRSGEDIIKYLPDEVHPNLEGGKIYADEITNYLDNYDWNIDFKSEPMTVNNLENATLFMADKYVAHPWKVSETDMRGKNPTFIYSDEVGATLELDFYGSVFGLYSTRDGDSGDLEFCIDGGEWGKVSMWDTFCLSFDRACCEILADNLEKTHHHIKMRIPETKNEQSKGHAIRIGAFLWEKE